MCLTQHRVAFKWIIRGRAFSLFDAETSATYILLSQKHLYIIVVRIISYFFFPDCPLLWVHVIVTDCFALSCFSSFNRCIKDCVVDHQELSLIQVHIIWLCPQHQLIDFVPFWKQWSMFFLYPATQKVTGYYVIPSKPFECPSVRPSALRFRTLTWVVFDRFSSNFACTLISGRSGLGLQIG